jgi:hypothetical protein
MRLYSTLPRLFAIAPPKAGAALLPRSVWATECPRLARSVGSSANHAKQIGRTSLALPRVNRTDSHSESTRPLSHGRISPAFGRPTSIQPFPNPDMDRINRHATTSQPSLVSNPRATRFRHSHPKSVILQPQPLLQPQPTATKQTCPQQAAKVPRSGSSCNSAMLKMIEILFSNHRKIIFV